MNKYTVGDIDWSNLVINKCPKCSKDLVETFSDGIFQCSCSFKITEKRFREIVTDMKNQQLEREYNTDPFEDW